MVGYESVDGFSVGGADIDMRAKPKIVVLGSINMDLVVRCGRLPVPGETLLAESSQEICGGKGANQAVAAVRAGGQVSMIGRVGEDAFAGRLVESLKKEGIGCSMVHRTANCSSGLAIVGVEESGQNSIMVVPGSNGRLSVEDVAAARSAIKHADVLLVQLEVPVDTVLAAIRVARKAGVKVILDPAPAPRDFPEALLDVDLLCPNEAEVEALSGVEVRTEEQASKAAMVLQSRGAKCVAITMGDQGAFLMDDCGGRMVPSFPVRAIDTTAAGDAFAGALGVRWAEGAPLHEAVQFANAAGALAASRMGAQPGMGTREEIGKLLEGRDSGETAFSSFREK